MAGALRISGLPYTNKTGPQFRSPMCFGFFNGVALPASGVPAGFVESTNSTIHLHRSTTASGTTTGTALLDAAQVNDNLSLYFKVTYLTDR